MVFDSEAKFEDALIKLLFNKGWEKEVLAYKTEEELIQNWADILFNNNIEQDRLNNCPLTKTEMQQIITQINSLRSPYKLNSFINGKTLSIKRDNPDDKLHYGKNVSLKIYDRMEIAGGKSRYQIVRQPKFATPNELASNRRGDIMLLINGMPVIHIELKKSGVPLSQACYQIEKYSKEGVFSGLFSLVQIFVAMTPSEMVYFANPGKNGTFNRDFYFHWANFNNEPINMWDEVVANFLNIPMAHMLIGFYMVPDDKDGILKVMRSYQYYAAYKISDKVSKIKWGEKNIYGGYIWHTTGSGKTLTSFKTAQLIANSKDADKVIFLMDRVELGVQTLQEFKGFADDSDDIQSTEDTYVLIDKLTSSEPNETIIVTSIQKMSNINRDGGLCHIGDIERIAKKRLVFIIDECHRSTFGDMLSTIKNTFPDAIFFGFTGTPIHNENKKKEHTTANVFGDELHRYSIADGIRDNNVLKFDITRVETFKERDLRELVAKETCEVPASGGLEEIAYVADRGSNGVNSEKFFYILNEMPMAGEWNEDGKYVKGIEDELPPNFYDQEEHRKAVMQDVEEEWIKRLSRNGKFHAMLATESIAEAIKYYKLFKKSNKLKVVALFDPSIDNDGNAHNKEKALIEMLDDYNKRYGVSFNMATYSKYKKDVALRLAHKTPYNFIERSPDKVIDLIIVVDQMLTGFDSKWINTLYLDKVMKNEAIIQAFSRTNRLFGREKPFGIIRYYRKPYTMERNIYDAIKLYSGDKEFGLFVDKVEMNILHMNEHFETIEYIFNQSKIKNFEKLPEDKESKAKFAKEFKELVRYYEAAKIQGYVMGEEGKLNIHIFRALEQRYNELCHGGSGDGDNEDVDYDIEPYITSTKTDIIDANYLNSRFTKYLKKLEQNATKEEVEEALNELHKTFPSLSQEDQKFAGIILHEYQSGDLIIDPNKTFFDYIVEYKSNKYNDNIHSFALNFGVDEEKLRELISFHLTEKNLNEYGRFDKIISTVDSSKAKEYIESVEGIAIPTYKVNMKVNKYLKRFILEDHKNL